MGNPLDHSVDLTVAGGPVHRVEACRIFGFIKVDLHRREAFVLDPWKLPVALWPDWVVHIGVAVDADLIAELPTKQLIYRKPQRFPREIPKCNLNTSESSNVLSPLCTCKYSRRPNSLPDSLNVEGILPHQHPPPIVHQGSSANRRICRLAVS